MRSSMRRRMVAFAATVLAALAVVGTVAASASALVRGPAAATMNLGRGGRFPQVSPPSAGAAAFIGGLAVSAGLIGLVAWLAIRSDRRSRASLRMAAHTPATGELRRPSSEDQRRKAA